MNLWSGRRRQGGGDAGDDADDLDGRSPSASMAPPEVPTSPMRMEGREPLWGYATALLLAAGGVANLLDTTGKGALPHPVLWPSWVGLALAAALAASLQLRNRLLSPLTAIFAAFFLTLERGPDSLAFFHILLLVGAVGFAVAVTMRQRRAQRLLGPPRGRRARGERARPAGRAGAGGADSAGGPRRPAASRRYTPPKSAKGTSNAGRSRTAKR